MNPTKGWQNKKALYYRCLQLLTAYHKSAFSPIAITRQEFSVVFAGVICTYATIKLYGKLHFLIYLTMPTSIVIMLFYEKYFHGCSASFGTSCRELLGNYEKAMQDDVRDMPSSSNGSIQNSTELQRATWRSFCPLRIFVNSFYYLQRSTVLTFGSLILANAINMLLV